MSKPIILQSAKVTTRRMHETVIIGGTVEHQLKSALTEIDNAVALLTEGGAWALDGECEIIIHVSQKMKQKEA